MNTENIRINRKAYPKSFFAVDSKAERIFLINKNNFDRKKRNYNSFWSIQFKIL